MMFLRAAIDTMGDDLTVIGGSAVTTTDRAGVGTVDDDAAFVVDDLGG
jgi:hypothetical protein